MSVTTIDGGPCQDGNRIARYLMQVFIYLCLITASVDQVDKIMSKSIGAATGEHGQQTLACLGSLVYK